MEQLIQKLKDNNLIDDAGNIILEAYENGLTQNVDIGTFNTFFGDKTFTYANLIGSHTFTWNDELLTKTGVELGYKKYFEQWKTLGII